MSKPAQAAPAFECAEVPQTVSLAFADALAWAEIRHGPALIDGERADAHAIAWTNVDGRRESRTMALATLDRDFVPVPGLAGACGGSYALRAISAAANALGPGRAGFRTLLDPGMSSLGDVRAGRPGVPMEAALPEGFDGGLPDGALDGSLFAGAVADVAGCALLTPLGRRVGPKAMIGAGWAARGFSRDKELNVVASLDSVEREVQAGRLLLLSGSLGKLKAHRLHVPELAAKSAQAKQAMMDWAAVAFGAEPSPPSSSSARGSERRSHSRAPSMDIALSKDRAPSHAQAPLGLLDSES